MADVTGAARWMARATATVAVASFLTVHTLGPANARPADPISVATSPPAHASAAPTHPGAVVDDAATEVLDRREYQPARRGWLQRLREEARAWFAQRLAGLLAGGRGAVFAWLVVGVGVLAAAAGVWWMLRRTSRDPGEELPAVLAPRDRSPDEWWADAEHARAAGDLVTAVRAAYHGVIAELAADDLVDGSDGSTVGEHRRDLRGNAPAVADRFDALAIRVDDVLYGPAVATAHDVDALRSFRDDLRVLA